MKCVISIYSRVGGRETPVMSSRIINNSFKQKRESWVFPTVTSHYAFCYKAEDYSEQTEDTSTSIMMNTNNLIKIKDKLSQYHDIMFRFDLICRGYMIEYSIILQISSHYLYLYDVYSTKLYQQLMSLYVVVIFIEYIIIQYNILYDDVYMYVQYCMYVCIQSRI